VFGCMRWMSPVGSTLADASKGWSFSSSGTDTKACEGSVSTRGYECLCGAAGQCGTDELAPSPLVPTFGTPTGTTGSCSCSCDDGYSGTYCTTSVACTAGANATACAHGGVPTGVGGSCGCDCSATGYMGSWCETAAACTTGPNGQACLHGGVPVGMTQGNSLTGCACSCAEFVGMVGMIGSYQGDNCETAVACTTNYQEETCQNGGTTTGTFAGNTMANWSGSRRVYISPCETIY
jgi:hypothetical protein